MTSCIVLPATETKPVRVYLDGCFDVMHYGHANALRQARMLGDQLVVGLISDDEIRQAKGPPVMNYQERKTLVSSVKWVDEVIDGESVLYYFNCTGHCVSALAFQTLQSASPLALILFSRTRGPLTRLPC